MSDRRQPVFFDTNVLLYLALLDPQKADRSEELLLAGGVVSVQVLNEFVAVSRRKARRPWNEMADVLDAVRINCSIMPLTVEVHERALLLLDRFKLNIYDANIVAAALLAGCTTLWSEDMHDGLIIDGLTIRNPYAAP